MKGERLISKIEKWRLTMIESCKQCGLTYLPELAAPSSLAEWVNSEERVSSVTKAEATKLNIVASLEEGVVRSLKFWRPLANSTKSLWQ